MTGPEVVTLGCRLNAVEGEAMRALAAGADDLVIVNSCAVTNEAVKQARQAIRQAARRRPDARIVVTGCAAQLDPTGFAAMPEVAAVIGNADKRVASSFRLPFAPSEGERPATGASTSLGTNGLDGGSKSAVADTTTHRARAFVEVQNGCDHRCTFCIIPFARGPSRSVPAGVVVERIRALVDRGFGEVVLTGVDTASYGPDLPGAQTLGHLIERILTLVPRLARLRVSSLDSMQVDDRLFALVTQEPRVQPHLHLSLQHGDDLILKRMKRRHSRADAVDLVARLKAARPDLAIGADLIAGFPTESEQAARNTIALLDACDIVFGHIFPYSPRAGTPAARMPQLDPALIRARARRLRAAAEARRSAWLAGLVGTVQSVLIEGEDGRGHCGNYARARIVSGAAPRGQQTNGAVRGGIAAMRVTHVERDTLVGDLA